MPTATAEARAWIDGLPGGTFFFASEVPGRPSVVRPLLSRLAADHSSPVHREMQGFYAKLWHEDDQYKPPFSDHITGALRLAGLGGGYARLYALNGVGWSLQLPSRYDFAVVGRPPTSPWPRIRFRRRSNTRRHRLNWAEVTVIEAVRFFGYIESCPWAEAMESTRAGVVHGRLRISDSTLRPSMIEWASERERNQPSVFRQRIDELCAALAAR